MKAFATLLLLVPLTACAGGTDTAPSLAPRAIEAQRDVPVPVVVPLDAGGTVDAALSNRIATLLADATRADQSFAGVLQTQRPRIRAAAGAARGSDDWIAGQMARSELVSARQRTSEILSDADTLLVEEGLKGTGSAGLDAIRQAQRRINAMIASETAAIDAL